MDKIAEKEPRLLRITVPKSKKVSQRVVGNISTEEHYPENLRL